MRKRTGDWRELERRGRQLGFSKSLNVQQLDLDCRAIYAEMRPVKVVLDLVSLRNAGKTQKQVGLSKVSDYRHGILKVLLHLSWISNEIRRQNERNTWSNASFSNQSIYRAKSSTSHITPQDISVVAENLESTSDSSEKACLDDHLSYRRTHKPQKIEIPTATHLSFEKFHFQLPVPYVIYADFESIITPNIRQVNAVSLHEPCGYCYVVIEPDGKSVKPPTVYREIDAAKLFVSSMLKEEEEISSILKTIISLSITSDEEKLFKSAVNCHICGDELTKDRVHDHDHLNGKYRGLLTIFAI
ncbi:hypothetical protein AVEN_255551-1 [Araneus ventricosus]|uniref:DNA-directed DNA polymerase n=1 Tax=Araneus ventricosus TaxID=182803 RepID=A0A4Y2NJS4_ARAVE|nr:hypothetical protein AVEN_255551-1 [Araneus ventricosus]